MKNQNKFAVILSILFITVSFVNAQTNACFPINSATGLVELKGKIFVEGKTKDELFNKVVVWGTEKSASQPTDKDKADSYNNSIVKDREAGIFKFNIPVMYRYKGVARFASYSITVHVGDGFMDYTANNFMINKKPLEQYLLTKEGDMFYKSAFEDYCKKMNYTLKELNELK